MRKNPVSLKNKVSLKNMEYNRYIAVRYSLALLFFANVNWFISLFVANSIFLFVPLLLLVYAIFSIYEQIRLYSNKGIPLKHTKRFFLIQLTVNSVLLVLSFITSFYNLAFPFMSPSIQGFLGIEFILVIGIGIEAISLKKITKISNKKDRLYKEVIKYKKALKVSE